MPITAELTYTIGGEKNIRKGQCRNLSHSGIQFKTDAPLKEGTSLEITIDTKSDKFKPMIALVEIIRVELLDKDTYEVAGIIRQYK